MKLMQIVSGNERNFSYVVWDDKSKEALVIDSSYAGEEILAIIKKEALKLKFIINTHSHYDHVEDNEFVKKSTKAKLLMHEEEGMNCDVKLNGGEEIFIGKTKAKIIHTPGHSKGAICIQIENNLFTGDTLFVGAIGEMHFPGGDEDEMVESLKKISSLDENIIVWPGHDYGVSPKSTIGDEKRFNPYLKKILLFSS